MTYFDTDIVVHSIVIQDSEKHNYSIDIIKQAIIKEDFFITFLVLQETAFVLSRLGFSNEFISHNVLHLSTFASFQYSKELFSRACQLTKTLSFRHINDCVHTAIAEQFCNELVTYNKKDFTKIAPLTNLKISVLGHDFI